MKLDPNNMNEDQQAMFGLIIMFMAFTFGWLFRGWIG